MTTMDEKERSDWRNINSFPAYGGDDWICLSGAKVIAKGLPQVLEKCAKWQPFTSYLVGAPGAPRLLPPPYHSALTGRLVTSLRTAYMRAGLMWLTMAAVMLVMAYVFNRSDTGAIFFVLAPQVLALVVYNEYRTLHDIGALQARASFLYWLQRSRNMARLSAVWILIVALPGALQYLLATTGVTAEAQIVSWGAMVQNIRGGEYWRLIPGPYLHLSPLHLATNVGCAALAGSFATALFGWRASLAIFATANLVGAAMQVALMSPGADALVGVSAGIFALFSYAITRGQVTASLPPGWWLTLAACMLLMLFGSVASTGQTAHFAHVGGLLVGVLGGFVPAVRGLPGKPHTT